MTAARIARCTIATLALAAVASAATVPPPAAPGCDPPPKQRSAMVVAGNARFTVVTPTLLRLEYRADAAFVDARSYFAIDRGAGATGYWLDRHADGSLDLKTGRLHLSYRPDGQPFHAGNLAVEINRGHGSVTWRPGDRPQANLGGTVRSLDAIADPIDLGEGLIARDGWALVDDSSGPIEAGDWYRDRPPGPGRDWYLFGYGEEYRTAFADLATIAGPVPLPRRYQLGSWFSRWAPLTSGDFRAVVQEYAENRFPLDVVVMDMDWHAGGWYGWSWNRALLPDAEALLAELDAASLAVALNLHPAGVGPDEDRYADFMRALGRDPASGETVPFDAGDRRYLDALYCHVQRPLVADGADFWWLDWSGFETTPTVPSLGSEAALNRFYTDQTGAQGLRGAHLGRWAGWGDHRHPIHFSGDAFSHFRTLEFEIPFTSTAGNAGCFFWSHDIGGFRGPFDVPLYPEIFARWVQFGAMSPALRLHSFADKRPWAYPSFATDSMRASFELRARLFPYIYSSAAASAAATWPLVRPMYLDWPGDERAYHNPTQYLLGDHLLVAPVSTAGTGPGRVARRPVWFPPGTWFNAVTGERVDGDREALVSADIDELPVYVKGGVPIPMQPLVPRMATAPLTELVVRCWPGPDGETGRSTLYEDDGVSRDHELGRSARTELSCARVGPQVLVTVGPASGSFAGQPADRSLRIELPETDPPVAATVNGSPVAAEYDAAARTAVVRVPSRSIAGSTTVEVRLDPASPGTSRAEALARRLRGVLADAATWDDALARPQLTADQRNALLALRGYGVERKNEGAYLHRGAERFYAYAPEPVDLEVYTFRRSSWRSAEERFAVPLPPLPTPPVGLDVALPADVPSGPQAALGERRTRGIAVRFGPGGLGPAVWSTTGPYDHIAAWWVDGPYPQLQSGGGEAKRRDPSPPLPVLRAGADGILDLGALSPLRDQVAYATAILRSDRAQSASLAIASDDGAAVSVNGVEVYSELVARPLNQPDRVKVELAAGVNEIRVKVLQFTGEWKLWLGIESSAPVFAEPL